jgi:hypothetical protein
MQELYPIVREVTLNENSDSVQGYLRFTRS